VGLLRSIVVHGDAHARGAARPAPAGGRRWDRRAARRGGHRGV